MSGAADPPVALVSGGGRGIGAAVVRALAESGFRVCFTYERDHESAEHLVATMSQVTSIVAVRADAAREEDVVRSFEAAEELGDLRVVVNNAGATLKVASLVGWTSTELRRALEVNLYSALLGTRTALQRWSADPQGRCIVNVSSAAALTGAPHEYVAYAAAKAGVEALTVGAAKEVAALGIRVNAVAPGTTETGIHAAAGDPGRVDRVAASLPGGRVARPEEVAAAVLWLVSSEASYVSGAVLRVTGGS